MPADAIIYLIHDDDQLKDHVGKIAENLGIATQVVESPEELVDAYDDGRDSCLITDLKLHGCSLNELNQTLEDQSISMPTIFVTAIADVATVVEVMRRGAVTLLESPFSDDQLRDAIVEAVTRDSIERQTKLRRHELQTRIEQLTDKERKVMNFVVDGVANKVIAKRLGVSIRTVESRRQAVFQKMQVHSLAELVRCVVEADANGL